MFINTGQEYLHNNTNNNNNNTSTKKTNNITSNNNTNINKRERKSRKRKSKEAQKSKCRAMGYWQNPTRADWAATYKISGSGWTCRPKIHFAVKKEKVQGEKGSKCKANKRKANQAIRWRVKTA
ncbi:hypothetical protein NEOLEDRAFT_1139751 [Neolentinus lepideus HHB14362 ss-1]|uniref:Uncharacterized protein n=1 Tax=Neolentinus lepideus HHB14362 ss-1 TaxID=1314782 RepID=A0A165PJQ6_9AGAM|nr:hypothetical protein NEOLEDRAFT_1139751 [Neolentinus lepideus HHB14362 ss-1]